MYAKNETKHLHNVVHCYIISEIPKYDWSNHDVWNCTQQYSMLHKWHKCVTKILMYANIMINFKLAFT